MATITGTSLSEILNGTALADLIRGLDGNDSLDGGGGDDSLDGGAGNDTLTGGTGSDSLTGGAGNDVYYVDSLNDKLIELANGGSDLVFASVSCTLAAEVEHLTLTGASKLNGTGNALANLLTGNGANNALFGLGGADTLVGGAGNDTLDGGGGNDQLAGGAGDDVYYVDSTTDQVIEAASAGSDLVYATVAHTLSLNVEKLTLQGSAAIDGVGNALANTLIGNAAANRLTGLDGNDSLDGGAGNDTLAGGNGDDTLQGSLGSDRMEGGAGNDSYYVDALGDQVTESLNAGTDRVYASISYLLGANLENLSLTGSAAIDGIGNALNNALTGNTAANNLVGLDGNDSLDGGTGNDTLAGGLGNDTLKGGLGDDHLEGGFGNDLYYVDTVGDLVVEAAAGGTDRVSSAVSFTLNNELENLWLTGSAALTGIGNALANDIGGNAGASLLLGLGGDDNLYDGTGNDTLDGGEGNDSLSGGLGNDSLIGGAGNDTLDGNTGNDTLTGGAGNDSYYVDTVLDVISEDLGGGDDKVYATVSLTLAANLEQLTLTGTAAINGTGNDLANTITGNTAANSLDGGIGDDTLAGGAGNDSLDGGGGADHVDGGAGNDLLHDGHAFNLGGYWNDYDDVISGGAGNDSIYGAFGDVADGGDGDDYLNIDGYSVEAIGNSGTIIGGNGNDTLVGGQELDGGAGNDQFVCDGGLLNEQVDYTISGGPGDDYVSAHGQDVRVTLGDGNDVFEGIASGIFTSAQSGLLAVYGDDGDDYINGTGGWRFEPDTWSGFEAYGGLGNDTLVGAGDTFELDGGPGVDLVVLEGYRDQYVFTIGMRCYDLHNLIDVDFGAVYYNYSLSNFEYIAFDSGETLLPTEDLTFVDLDSPHIEDFRQFYPSVLV